MKSDPNAKFTYCVQIDAEGDNPKIYLHPLFDSPNQQWCIEKKDHLVVNFPNEAISDTSLKKIKITDSTKPKSKAVEGADAKPKVEMVDHTSYLSDMVVFGGELFAVFEKKNNFTEDWIYQKSLKNKKSLKYKPSAHNCNYFMKLMSINTSSDSSGEISLENTRDIEVFVPTFCIEKNPNFTQDFNEKRNCLKYMFKNNDSSKTEEKNCH